MADNLLLIVSQGLVEHQDGVSLHPDVFLWGKQLSGYKRQWFACADKNPLGWYAALCDAVPAALLAEKCKSIPENTRQCWVASPYHAMVGRESVRIMPEGAVGWCAADARWLCDLLNPLFAEEGMCLHALDAALLLTCEQVMDATPAPFATIAGHQLPNRHPQGKDGGRLMRLHAEIQMSLHGKHAEHRINQPDIHGLWLWGACPWPNDASVSFTAVATRNAFLQALSDGRDAVWTISEAEKLHDLLAEDALLPNRIVLSGAGKAVLLSKTFLPRFGRRAWRVGACKTEVDLLKRLKNFDAA